METRDINNYYPFKLTLNIVPYYFVWDIKKRFLSIKVKCYLNENSFNNFQSSFSLLDDAVEFSGSVYDSLIENENFIEKFNLLKDTAFTVSNFTENDLIEKILIDSENTLVGIIGSSMVGTQTVTGDPSVYFGATQNKFELLKTQYPELVTLYYALVIGIFSMKQSNKQPIYQEILSNQ